MDCGEGTGMRGNVVLLQTSSGSWVQGHIVIGGQLLLLGGGVAVGVWSPRGGDKVLGARSTGA